jgi:hypothetical protein
MTTPSDERPLSSEEMIRRAHADLTKPPGVPVPASIPIERPAAAPKPGPPPKTARRMTRITPKPAASRTGQPNVQAVRAIVAIMVVIALIGLGVAILVTSVATGP